jgi:hypothetical protein
LIVAHLECPDIVNLLRGSVAGAAGALLPRQCSSRAKCMAREGQAGSGSVSDDRVNSGVSVEEL